MSIFTIDEEDEGNDNDDFLWVWV